MAAISTEIRRLENDPRYKRYVRALLQGGISLETAMRAAVVRMEGEAADAAKWDRYDETTGKKTYKKGYNTADPGALTRGAPAVMRGRFAGSRGSSGERLSWRDAL